RIESGFQAGYGRLTVANGFSNAGEIEIIQQNYTSYTPVFTVSQGALNNADGSIETSGNGFVLSANILNNGIFSVNNLKLTHGGEFIQQTGVFEVFEGKEYEAAALNDPMSIQGGVLRGAGLVDAEVEVGDLSGNGAVAPGFSADLLTIDHLGLFGTGSIDIELGGTTANTEYDRLVLTGPLVLDGILNVSLINEFEPSAGDSFTIIEGATSLTGDFNTQNLPDISSLGLRWEVVTTPSSVLLNVLSDNAAPTVSLFAATTSLAENTSIATDLSVAQIIIVDDTAGTNTLTLSGADAALFKIIGSELFLKAGTLLDHETNGTLDVTVEVDDAEVGSDPDDTVDLSITVTDVNEAPTISLFGTTTSLAENTSITSDLSVAQIIIADDTAGTNTLSLSGADAALFEIAGSELFLKAGTLLDHETRATLDVTVEVDDESLGEGPDDTVALTINVTDVNEAPMVALSNTSTSLSENTDTSSAIKVADIAITDDAPGSNDLTLSGADAALFEIVGTELFLRAGTLLDHETNGTLDVTVEVDDAGVGASPDDSATLAIDVTDDNEPPVANDDAYSTDDNAPFSQGFAGGGGSGGGSGSAFLIDGLGGAAGFGDIVLQANDDDSSEAVDITSVFGVAGFNFFGTFFTDIYINNNGNITFNGPLSTYTPFAMTGDTDNPIIAPFFTDVDTRDGAQPPTPGGNSTGSNLVYGDLDTTGGRYGLGVVTITWDDVGYFSGGIDRLNAFQLRLHDRGDGNADIEFRYEAINWAGESEDEYARAGFSAANGIDFFEFPQSGDEAAMLDLPNQVGSTFVNAEDGGVKFGLLANDTDPDNDPLTLTAINGDMTAVGSEFALPSGALLTTVVDGSFRYDPNGAFDHLASGVTETDTFTYSISDGNGGTDEGSVVVTVSGVNYAPQIADQTYAVAENSAAATVVGSVVANDDDNDPLTYSITDGTGLGLFDIDPDSGVISVAAGAVLDAESTGSYTLAVQVSDAEASDTAQITINLSDVNEAPTAVALSNAAISEAAAAGAAIGDLSGVDPEHDSLSFHITADSSAGAFAIADNQLVIADSSLLDHSSDATQTVTIEVRDPEGLGHSEVFTVDIQAGGQSNTFTNTLADGDMFNPANWSLGYVPGGTDNLTIPADSGNVTIPDGFTAASISNNGGTLSFSGSVNIGTYTQTGGQLHLDGGDFTGTLDVIGGTLTGSGIINGVASVFGGIAPGSSPGIFSFTDLVLNENSETVIEVSRDYDGDTIPLEAGEDYDRINVSNTLTADGVLNIELLPDYTPVAGDRFTVISADTIDGAFSAINLPDLSALGLEMQAEVVENSLVVNVAAVNPYIPPPPTPPVVVEQMPVVVPGEGEQQDDAALEQLQEELEKELREEGDSGEETEEDEEVTEDAPDGPQGEQDAGAEGEAAGLQGIEPGDGQDDKKAAGLSDALKEKGAEFERQRQQVLKIFEDVADMLSCGG
ncbi:MAG: hypothetical protein GY764_13760, partial [Halieaceae bacterium]|nr:hypothetical protein [Halieaceae bacterium]